MQTTILTYEQKCQLLKLGTKSVSNYRYLCCIGAEMEQEILLQVVIGQL